MTLVWNTTDLFRRSKLTPTWRRSLGFLWQLQSESSLKTSAKTQAERWRRVCAQDHSCRMNRAQISGQEENDLLGAAVVATSTYNSKKSQFSYMLVPPSRSLPLAQAAMGVHHLSCFHALRFGGRPSELVMAHGRAVIAWD